MEPNRHAICFTATNRATGRKFSDQFSEIISGSLAEAAAAMAATIAGITEPAPGTFLQHENYGKFRLLSWHEETPSFGAAPLSGPEFDRAWNEGPGRAA